MTQVLDTARILSDEEREAQEAVERRVTLQRQAADHWRMLCRERGRRYAACKLDTYEIVDDRQQFVVDALREYASAIRENVLSGRGIVLYGPSGTGKDHLAWAMVRVAALAGFQVVWNTGITLYADRRDGIDSQQTERQFVKTYTRADVLLLSDPIPPRDDLTNSQKQLLYRILDSRYSDLRPTWVTINVSTRRQADEKISTQISERLIDGSLTLECAWPSYRRSLSKN